MSGVGGGVVISAAHETHELRKSVESMNGSLQSIAEYMQQIAKNVDAGVVAPKPGTRGVPSADDDDPLLTQILEEQRKTNQLLQKLIDQPWLQEA